MAEKGLTVILLITFGVQLACSGLIRPPAIPPYASTLSVYLSPPPPPPLPLPLPLGPPPPLLTPTLPPSPFNPFFLPHPGLSILPSAPLLPSLPPPFVANGLRFFSTKGVFPSLLPAYPPVLPAPPAPLLPPVALPPAALPPALLPSYPAPSLPAFPAPALPAFPAFPNGLSAGPLPFGSIKHLLK